MKCYPIYKDSEIKWLGKLPAEWRIKRLKHLIEGKLEYGANEVAEFEDVELPRYIRITDFGDDGNLRQDTFKSLTMEQAKGYFLAEGDVLFARSGATVGKTFQFKQYKGRACFAGYLIKARPNKKVLLSDFLYLFTKSRGYENWKDAIFNQATIQNIGADKYQNIFLPVPSLQDQKLICEHLNRKTAQIDGLIAKKEQMIELLKEERTTVINQAVTKGLDPKVEIKDSGIEWLGKMPRHWQVKKLKFIASLKSGEGIVADLIKADDQYPVFGGNGFRGYTSQFTHDGDFVLIGRQGALCGNINYANGKFWASEHAIVVTLIKGHNVFWCGELLQVMNLNQYSQSAAQPGLAVENLQNLLVPVPPKDEQKAIEDYLTCKTVQIDELVNREKKIIEFLKEYRTALVSEVVTGKIDIRGED